jgi:Ca2+-transporting ATPase
MAPEQTAADVALTDARCGLTAAEAARRLAADGPNELPSQRPRPLQAVALDVLAEPMQHCATFQALARSSFDPMERAIHEAAATWAPASVAKLQWMDLVREYELTPELLAVTHVWSRKSAQLEIAVKGAPETVFDLCRIDSQSRARLLKLVAAHAAGGLRVLAVAREPSLRM